MVKSYFVTSEVVMHLYAMLAGSSKEAMPWMVFIFLANLGISNWCPVDADNQTSMGNSY